MIPNFPFTLNAVLIDPCCHSDHDFHSQVVPLTSTFRRDDDMAGLALTVAQEDTITFTTLTCTIESLDRHPEVIENMEERIGKMERTALVLNSADRGKSKDVFKV